jgi:hypothetical protein
MKKGGVAVLMAALLLAGCGTIARGRTEKVVINTKPAGAAVRLSLGDKCPRSPCTFDVKRNRSFDAFATKPGYREGTVHVGTKISKDGALKTAGNFLLPGGSAGFVIDAVSGAALDHTPNPATIVLTPDRRGGKASTASRQPSQARKRVVPVS